MIKKEVLSQIPTALCEEIARYMRPEWRIWFVKKYTGKKRVDKKWVEHETLPFLSMNQFVEVNSNFPVINAVYIYENLIRLNKMEHLWFYRCTNSYQPSYGNLWNLANRYGTL